MLLPPSKAVLSYDKDTDILSIFQIFLTFCQRSDTLSVHIIHEILFDSNKIHFRIPIKALPVKALSTKMKQKCFAHPSEQAKQIQTKIGFALSVCHTVISKVPRHLYNNLKPCCWHPTISVHNPFLRDCP